MSADVCRYTGCESFAVAYGFCDEHVLDAADRAREAAQDEMIAQASIPNAAALLRRATKKGLIQPTSGYFAVA